MPGGLVIPTSHDPVVAEQLARWRVLEKASPLAWSAELGASWHRPPELPQYAPLIAALTAGGVDPHAVERPEHEQSLHTLRAAAADWTVPEAAATFVAGLWSAPAAWRTALPGVLLERRLPDHPFTPWSDTAPDLCEVCGHRNQPRQAAADWAARLTGGSPLDGELPGYAQAFTWLTAERPEPTEYDRWALGAILATIRALPAGSRSTPTQPRPSRPPRSCSTNKQRPRCSRTSP